MNNIGTENEVMLGVVLVFALIWLVAMVGSILNYVLTSLAMYTIADRRRISGAIWAWFPIGSSWLLGAIVDYHESLHGVKRRWRTLLLVLSVIPIIGYVLTVVFMVGMGFLSADFVESSVRVEFIGAVLLLYLLMIVVYFLPTMALSICTYVCHYKLFEALAPLKAVKYFVISLLVPFGLPFCLMKCRNSLLGVPQPPAYAPGPYGGPAPVYYTPAPFGEPAPAPVPEPAPIPAGSAESEQEPAPAVNPAPNAQPEAIPRTGPSQALPKNL